MDAALGGGFVIGAANELVGIGIPDELAAKDGFSERKEVAEEVGGEGVARREGTCHVGW